MADLEALYARRAAARAKRRRVLRALALVVLVGSLAGVVVVLEATPVARRSPPVESLTPAVGARPVARAASPRGSALGIARIKRLATLGLPVYCAGSRGSEVAFTFDDGPGPYTYLALRKLARANERATFFVVGRSIRSFPRWLPKELAAAAIGDHTMTHPFLPGLLPSQVEAQIAQDKQLIERDTGQSVDLFRPPYGARNRTVDHAAKALGLLEVLWSVDSRDSRGANWARIIAIVEQGLRPGAIILMHENRGQTIRALTALMPYLHRRHLRSVSLPELLASDPPSVAQLRAGAAGCGRTGKLRTGARAGRLGAGTIAPSSGG